MDARPQVNSEDGFYPLQQQSQHNILAIRQVNFSKKQGPKAENIIVSFTMHPFAHVQLSHTQRGDEIIYLPVLDKVSFSGFYHAACI